MISSLEQRILDSLSEKTVNLVKSLYRKNLGAEKDVIVGVRNEDLLYFLSCAERGWMPVGEHYLRSKSSESAAYFFMSANPDSTLLQKLRPSFVEELRAYFRQFPQEATFYTAAIASHKLYSNIGKIQAVCRYLQEKDIDIQKLLESYASHFRHRFESLTDDSGAMTLSDLGERFFDELVDSFFDSREIQGRISREENIFALPNRFRELYLLRQHVNPSVSNQQLVKDIQGFSDRGSILLGFSNNLLNRYNWGMEHPYAHADTEVGIHVPSKQLPLDASVLVGFEPQGTHEDKVLRDLGVL